MRALVMAFVLALCFVTNAAAEEYRPVMSAEERWAIWADWWASSFMAILIRFQSEQVRIRTKSTRKHAN